MQSLTKIISRSAVYSHQMMRVPVAAFHPPKKVQDKTPGEEKNYINKKEQELLKNLQQKTASSAPSVDPETKKLHDELKAIFTKHGASSTEGLLTDLVNWKKH